MINKEYKCAYPHCLHNGEPVNESASVKIGKGYYHWDCATVKSEIKECVDEYMECVEDKTRYPAAMRIINNMVFKNNIPTDFILNNIKTSRLYYAKMPTQILYGLRKIYWEKK